LIVIFSLSPGRPGGLASTTARSSICNITPSRHHPGGWYMAPQ
jgi:hypothetical protein